METKSEYTNSEYTTIYKIMKYLMAGKCASKKKLRMANFRLYIFTTIKKKVPSMLVIK